MKWDHRTTHDSKSVLKAHGAETFNEYFTDRGWAGSNVAKSRVLRQGRERRGVLGREQAGHGGGGARG